MELVGNVQVARCNDAHDQSSKRNLKSSHESHIAQEQYFIWDLCKKSLFYAGLFNIPKDFLFGIIGETIHESHESHIMRPIIPPREYCKTPDFMLVFSMNPI